MLILYYHSSTKYTLSHWFCCVDTVLSFLYKIHFISPFLLCWYCIIIPLQNTLYLTFSVVLILYYYSSTKYTLSHWFCCVDTVLSFLYKIHFISPFLLCWYCIIIPLQNTLYLTFSVVLILYYYSSTKYTLSHWFCCVDTVLSFLYKIHFISLVLLCWYCIIIPLQNTLYLTGSVVLILYYHSSTKYTLSHWFCCVDTVLSFLYKIHFPPTRGLGSAPKWQPASQFTHWVWSPPSHPGHEWREQSTPSRSAHCWPGAYHLWGQGAWVWWCPALQLFCRFTGESSMNATFQMNATWSVLVTIYICKKITKLGECWITLEIVQYFKVF